MRVLATLAFLAAAALQPVYGDVKPGSLFTDHMVLQQGMDIPIWQVNKYAPCFATGHGFQIACED